MYIKVRVNPGQKKESLIQKESDHFYISVREPAKRNLANIRVAEMLAAHFNVSRQQVRLLSGHTSPSKIFDIYKNP